MIPILNALGGMLHTLVYSLPVGWLPYVDVALTVMTGLSMLLTLLYFLYFDKWIGGVIFLVLSTCLWLMTPSVTEEVHHRQFSLISGSEVLNTVPPHADTTVVAAPAPKAP
ncbi:branched-chain amino acid aminotransferase [Mariprofundus ferrooxydans]|uniref:branched-chain amino acid aminotransferase n=1 Tax=Mariprofundus ferrooxydans TaxID=314344 RepID=UPI001430C040|nr:branched-chain amino acid aminotransferase [Mariprofundus ferrooxydans]